MNTRNERLSELLQIIGEAALTPEDDISLNLALRDMPTLMKQLNSLLDEEFVAGHDYAMDPTAPLLPGHRNQRRLIYVKPKRGPGRPKKNPEEPPRPSGKHVSAEDPDAGQ